MSCCRLKTLIYLVTFYLLSNSICYAVRSNNENRAPRVNQNHAKRPGSSGGRKQTPLSPPRKPPQSKGSANDKPSYYLPLNTWVQIHNNVKRLNQQNLHKNYEKRVQNAMKEQIRREKSDWGDINQLPTRLRTNLEQKFDDLNRKAQNPKEEASKWMQEDALIKEGKKDPILAHKELINEQRPTDLHAETWKLDLSKERLKKYHVPELPPDFWTK